jgi:hypothetical protein
MLVDLSTDYTLEICDEASMIDFPTTPHSNTSREIK